VRVMSLSFSALQRVERLAPEVQTVQLVDKPAVWPMLKRIINSDTIMGPGISLLREHPRVVDSMARHSRAIHVWTVNTEPDLELCLQRGVRALITDRPSYLLDLLDQRGEVAG
jgi:glycerophosphoryl diester phosphodiesterase